MIKTCKLLVIGDSNIGKTTLIHQFISDEYRSDFKATLGTNLSTKTFNINNNIIEVQIWDTAGTERFKSISMSHYRGADACILMFDITNRISFEHLNNWRRDVIDSVGIDNPEYFPFVLFANKVDLINNYEISIEEIKSWAELKSMNLFLISAKTGENIQNGFLYLLEKFINNYKNFIPFNPINENKNFKCC